MHAASVTYEELLTVTMEIEGIMNSRSLTYINPDVDGVLAPCHLFNGLSNKIVRLPNQRLPNSTATEPTDTK